MFCCIFFFYWNGEITVKISISLLFPFNLGYTLNQWWLPTSVRLRRRPLMNISQALPLAVCLTHAPMFLLALPLWPTSQWRSSQPTREAIKAFVCSYLGCMHIRLAATKSHLLQLCAASVTVSSAEDCQRCLDARRFLLVLDQFESFVSHCLMKDM